MVQKHTLLVSEEAIAEANQMVINQRLYELEHEQAQLIKLQQMSNALQTLAVSVEECTQWTDRECQLTAITLHTCQQQLGDEVALEAHTEHTQSMALESIAETLHRIWEAIVRTVKRIWDKIMGFFRSRDIQALYIRERLKRLMFTLEGLEGATLASATVQVGSSYQHLGKGAGAPQGPKELITGLADYRLFAAHLYSNYVSHLETTGRGLARTLDSFNYEQPISSVEAVNEVARHFTGEPLYAAAGAVRQIVHPDFPGDRVHGSYVLLGGRQLIVVEKEPKQDSSLEERTSSLTQTQVLLTFKHATVNAEALTITPYSISELRESLREVELLVQHLENHRQTRVMEQLSAIHKQILRVCEVIEKKATTHPDLVGRALQYATAYSMWCMHPLSEVSGSIQQIATQVMALVNINMRAYRTTM